MFEFSFEAMGTVLEIRVLDSVSKLVQEKIKSEVLDFTIYYDESLSRFKKESLVSTIANKKGIFTISNELFELLKIYEEINTITSGAVNPFIGNTISDLGYDANYSLRKKEKVRKTPKFSDTIKFVGGNKIQLLQEVLIDIGAAGKGYWVDKVSEILDKNKLGHYLINGSGDIYYKNTSNQEGLCISLENNQNEIFATTNIFNSAICGSGTGKRNWSIKVTDNLHHVIDANTGLPTENFDSVWIKTSTKKLPTTYADILATCLFFEEPEKFKQKVKEELGIDFEYMLVRGRLRQDYGGPSKKILVSKNFDADLKSL
jgi:thiamine biosynthesis lipoprotein